jgi:hypothetical protein
MFEYVTLTRTGVIWSGHLNPATFIGVVETVKVPLPCLLVGKVVCPLDVPKLCCSPDGSWPWDPLLMQPLVTLISADRKAVPPVLPAPATSPVADKVDVLFKRVAVAVGVPTKCRPPVLVMSVAEPEAVVAPSAGTAARATAISASTPQMAIFLIKVFLLYLVGLYGTLGTYKDAFTPSP